MIVLIVAILFFFNFFSQFYEFHFLAHLACSVYKLPTKEHSRIVFRMSFFSFWLIFQSSILFFCISNWSNRLLMFNQTVISVSVFLQASWRTLWIWTESPRMSSRHQYKELVISKKRKFKGHSHFSRGETKSKLSFKFFPQLLNLKENW